MATGFYLNPIYSCSQSEVQGDLHNLVEVFLFEEGIVRMEWPACSPDMNPIEHVWDTLGRRVAGRQPPPQTLQELERALLEEWVRIPQLVINSLIDSMPQRCSTLLAVRGNRTPY
ncbi:transposable element Tcb2 transposase [Trichonephila clavipes]|nr:transposable element Tcb2 transposase [Trichonephila clavipes]